MYNLVNGRNLMKCFGILLTKLKVVLIRLDGGSKRFTKINY